MWIGPCGDNYGLDVIYWPSELLGQCKGYTMNIYERVIEKLTVFEIFQFWPEIDIVLRRAVGPQPPYWQLPILACEAVGSPGDAAIPAVAAIACLQTSIILVDDLLDNDPRGQHHQFGAAAVSNMASAFQALGFEVINQIKADSKVHEAIHSSLNRMLYTTALGQYLDSLNPNDEVSYWKVVQTKSSPFFGAALEIGALAGGTSTGTADQLRRLGNIYGVMVQIHDDLSDTMAEPAGPDWSSGRSTLPILFALIAPHPERERFKELRQDVTDQVCLREAQEIIIRCGAVSYCVDQILRRYERSCQVLAKIDLKNPGVLQDRLDKLVAPVKSLVDSLAVS